MRKTRISVFVAAAAAALFAHSAQVTPGQARLAAQRWAADRANLHGESIGTDVRDARTVPGADGAPLFHIVRMEGGGVVVLSAETRIHPVIAFLSGDDIDESPDNPLWAILNRDLARRMRRVREASAAAAPRGRAGAGSAGDGQFADGETRWARLLAPDGARAKSGAGAGIAGLSDTWVSPLVRSEWDQSTVHGVDVYNKYTPKNYVCGCVATAFSQVMRYHRFPTASLPSRTYSCSVDGRMVDLDTMPGRFDWDSMPLVPENLRSVSESQAAAIGKLTYSVGVACRMNYSESGSGSLTHYGVDAITDYFGYADARYSENGSRPAVTNALLASLDYGKPVVLGVNDADAPGGHEIVGDGYGFNDGELYVHLNLGWAGVGDAWYDVMDFTTDVGYHFVFDDIAYNIMPTESGEIVSGRVVNRFGTPFAGVEVRLMDESGENRIAVTNTNERGRFVFLAESGATYTLKADHGDMYGSTTVTMGRSGDANHGSRQPGNRWGVDIRMRGDIGNHHVTFDPNTGRADGAPVSGSMESQLFVEDDEQALSPNAFTCAGHSFLGWATTPDGDVEFADGATVSFLQDATLYAVWTKVRYRVSYRPGANGTAKPDLEFLYPDLRLAYKFYGDVIQLEGALYDREYFQQTGWSMTDGGDLAYPLEGEFSEDATVNLYPYWTPNPEDIHTVTFDANGGTGEMDPQEFIGDITQAIDLNVFTRVGHAFVGWAISPDAPPVYSDGEETEFLADRTLYAAWKQNEYKISYFRGRNGVGYTCIEDRKKFGETLAVKDATFTRAGYEQTGWSLTDGGEQAYAFGDSYAEDADLSLFPVWKKIESQPGKSGESGSGGSGESGEPGEPGSGSGEPGSGSGDSGEPGSGSGESGSGSGDSGSGSGESGDSGSGSGGSGDSGDSGEPGTGSGESGSGSGGSGAGDSSASEAVRYEIYSNVTGAAPSQRCEYNGVLFAADGAVAGTVKVSVGKPNKKGLSSVKAVVTPAAGRKVSLKADGAGKAAVSGEGPTEIVMRGGEPCTVVLGSEALGGTYGVYRIDGARNFFKSKEASEKKAALALVAGWTASPVNIAGERGGVSVKIPATAKARATGTLADGRRLNISGIVLVGEKWLCVPVVGAKSGVAFALWLPREGGGPAVAGFGGDAVAGQPGAIGENAAFTAAAADPLWTKIQSRVLAEYLPAGVRVGQNGKKWSVPAPGKVVYRSGTTEVDESKTLENPSGLTLVYKPASGTFTGSFKVYSDVNGRLKSVKAKVSGVLVNGTGHGTATVSRLGSAAVEIR